jgi:deoxyribodipyrimidine photo-lyase
MEKAASIVWFRQDLRISDNEAITAATEAGLVLPIYILDDCAPTNFKIGSASKVWLHNSLQKLNESLGNNLNLYIGQANQIIELLINRYNIKSIFWNTCYEPWHLEQEKSVIAICKKRAIKFNTFNSNYLYTTNQTLKEDGSYYKVFTAYKNKAISQKSRSVSISNTNNIELAKDNINITTIQDLKLLPQTKWYKNLQDGWIVGEASAQNKLNFFIKNHLDGYKENRNHPNKPAISRLSPHLHFGEISPSQILEAISASGSLYANENDIEHFISEIIWREFSCYLLYHFKELPINNFNSKFNRFGWEDNPDLFESWKKGNTGYPLIDAGMRELWQTGYMHNRVRMVVSSFLIKNLNIHWHKGMNWFWDCLLDADLANNSASWQWVAGSGADAAPYFRIFNPITQGEKFDANGDYTRRFVPELKNIPDKYLFKPWTAPRDILRASGVTLGQNYPKPIIDLSSSRDRALESYKNL